MNEELNVELELKAEVDEPAMEIELPLLLLPPPLLVEQLRMDLLLEFRRLWRRRKFQEIQI